MAIEAPNLFAAGAALAGVSGSEAVLGSSGFQEATFTRVSAGRYTIKLTEPVGNAALVCLVCALSAGSAPMIAHASPNLVSGETVIGISTDNAAGVATDAGNIQLAIFRSKTDG